MAASGSSPPAWGASAAQPGHPEAVRFIPTCVGSIRSRRRLTLSIAVHPHLRGEHGLPHSSTSTPIGSSPPAWGACGRCVVEVVGVRFIPTCVGSIGYIADFHCAFPVHPHLRGEHVMLLFLVELHFGSSPPAWGAFPAARGSGGHPRFIPTCVGSIQFEAFHYRMIPVHPHLRGEHHTTSPSRQAASGSSPPAWGACRRSHRLQKQLRFIPTCVGSISRTSMAPLRLPVHPHLRGEHCRNFKSRCSVTGSSPPAWGAWKQFQTIPEKGRFIPTCVGSINRPPRDNVVVAVHPHLRGEHGTETSWIAS